MTICDPQKFRAVVFLVSGLAAISFMPCGRPLQASIVINFDSIDASAGGVSGAILTSYFASFGITSSGDPWFVFDVRNFVDNGVEFTAPASRLNFLGGGVSPHTNTLSFATPLESLSFTRNALIVTGPGGTTHPQWSAKAYDAANNLLDSVGEPLIATFTNVPLTTFTLSGPAIASVVFESDNLNFAGYGAVIFDDLTLTAVPESGWILLSGLTLVCGVAYAGRWLCRFAVPEFKP